MKKRILALTIVMTLLLSCCSVFAYGANVGVQFYGGAPSGICSYGNGFLVSDTFNKVVWYIQGTGVAMLAGNPGEIEASGEYLGGYADGSFAEALFKEPWAITPFLDGFAVSDTANKVVRFVGESSVQTISRAQYQMPTGLTTDEEGNLYVADTQTGIIYKIDTEGVRSEFVTALHEPMGLAWFEETLYVAETGKNRIVSISKDTKDMGVVAGAVVAAGGDEYYGGYADGPVGTARFDHPQGVAVAEDGTVYVADTNNHAIRYIKNGRVYTLEASENLASGMAQPRSMALKDGKIYVADNYNDDIFVFDQIGEKTGSYSDVPQTWYTESVKESSLRGLTDGVGGGKFAPSASMSRAMFVTMISRINQNADRNEIIAGKDSLEDVAADTWYTQPAAWAVSNKIVDGINGLFCPGRAITREQAITMLYRYAGAKNFTAGTVGKSASAYSDYTGVSDWAKDAIDWAVSRGVIEGYEADNTLKPQRTITRAEAVHMFINFMNIMGL